MRQLLSRRWLPHDNNTRKELPREQVASFLSLADRFVILDRGRPMADGTIDELTDDLIKRHLTV